ncbi:MAG TPA: magnesium/cobalt transporter CorA [Vicinamibacteria bacterium]
MFRVLEVSGGRVQELEGAEHVGRPPEGTLRWIDLRAPVAADLELLRQQFEFHPLALEDCAHFDERPKLEEYRDHVFLVTQAFSCPGEQVRHLTVHELHTFLGERYLVTVHQDELGVLEAVWRRVRAEPAIPARGVDFIYYLIADALVDSTFPILDRVADELDEIEDDVLASPDREDLQRIFELKRHLVEMRKVLSPQRDVFGMLAKRGDPRINERTALYLRDVYDHLVRINESIEANRDLLGNALDAYLSAVGQRTNEIMKYLTIMSAVFLPLAFVVGFFGQNFVDLPFVEDWMHSDHLMWGMIATCLALPIAMLAWFKSKRWL